MTDNIYEIGVPWIHPPFPKTPFSVIRSIRGEEYDQYLDSRDYPEFIHQHVAYRLSLILTAQQLTEG